MGVYRAAIVTENGQNLIAQALANEKPLIFTSAKTSSYSYPVGTDVPALGYRMWCRVCCHLTVKYWAEMWHR